MRTTISTSFVEYAKASPEDVLIQITACNRGPEAASLRLLPTLSFPHSAEQALEGGEDVLRGSGRPLKPTDGLEGEA